MHAQGTTLPLCAQFPSCVRGCMSGTLPTPSSYPQLRSSIDLDLFSNSPRLHQTTFSPTFSPSSDSHAAAGSMGGRSSFCDCFFHRSRGYVCSGLAAHQTLPTSGVLHLLETVSIDPSLAILPYHHTSSPKRSSSSPHGSRPAGGLFPQLCGGPQQAKWIP